MKRLSTMTAAALAAVGIAFTPAPAAADGDDLVKIIAGLAVAGIIVKAIDDRNNRDSVVKTHGKLLRYDDRYIDRRRVIDGKVYRYHRDGKRGPKAGRGYKKHALPDRCLRWVETSRGTRLAYGQRCLNRHYKFANKLPETCETVIRTPRGFRAVYGARCLRRDGWRVARR